MYPKGGGAACSLSQGSCRLGPSRQEMREVLDVEVVPFYRERAQDALDDMADEP